MRRVKIICTIGPATASDEKLDYLLQAGMDVARLNCSHGSVGERVDLVRRLRSASQRAGKPLCVFLDLRGPRLRMGRLPPEGSLIRAGQDVSLATEGTEPVPAGPGVLPVQSPFLAAGVKKGQRIFIDDGNIELSVLATDGRTVQCCVVRGGVVKTHKGINAPGAPLALPILEPEDLDDLRRTIQEGIDAVAVSFVRSAGDMDQVRAVVHAFNPALPLIAKMETYQAMEHLDSIIEASDAVMVARGDLGVELPTEQIPILQKRLIARVNAAGKPVITATQMLESMVEHERPTRAEASDVANAVFDGTDCVMLSAETSVGKYPVQTVEMMSRIVRAAEKELLARPGRGVRKAAQVLETPLAVSEAACHAASQVAAKAIVAFTQSGSTAGFISRCRPECPIIAFTPDEGVSRRLTLHWGVLPRVMPWVGATDTLIPAMEKRLLAEGFAARGDTIVLVAGAPLEARPRANFIKVHTL